MVVGSKWVTFQLQVNYPFNGKFNLMSTIFRLQSLIYCEMFVLLQQLIMPAGSSNSFVAHAVGSGERKQPPRAARASLRRKRMRLPFPPSKFCWPTDDVEKPMERNYFFSNPCWLSIHSLYIMLQNQHFALEMVLASSFLRLVLGIFYSPNHPKSSDFLPLSASSRWASTLGFSCTSPHIYSQIQCGHARQRSARSRGVQI